MGVRLGGGNQPGSRVNITGPPTFNALKITVLERRRSLDSELLFHRTPPACTAENHLPHWAQACLATSCRTLMSRWPMVGDVIADITVLRRQVTGAGTARV
jgi:hypothetical protein